MIEFEKKVAEKENFIKFYQKCVESPEIDSFVDAVIFGAREELRNQLGCKIPFPKLGNVVIGEAYKDVLEDEEGPEYKYMSIPDFCAYFTELRLNKTHYDAFLQLPGIDISLDGIFKIYKKKELKNESLIDIHWEVSCPFSDEDRATLVELDIIRATPSRVVPGGQTMSCHISDESSSDEIPF